MSRSAAHHHPAQIGWSVLSEAIKTNPHRGTRLLGTTASASIATMSAATCALSWLPGWMDEPDTSTQVSDVIALVLWASDPMYRGAVAGVRRTMEMEVASTLLTASEKEWKARGGRHRGWVRKHLEEDLRGRSAGAEPAPDFWELVRTNKRTAQLVDYVCVVRGIRMALWWPAQKKMSVLPLTGVAPAAGIINLNCDVGRVLLRGDTGDWRCPADSWVSSTVEKADAMVWTPPLCAPSVGTQTIAQIQERLTAIGAPSAAAGGKAAMWCRFLWHTLLASLNGVEKTDTLASSESDES